MTWEDLVTKKTGNYELANFGRDNTAVRASEPRNISIAVYGRNWPDSTRDNIFSKILRLSLFERE